MTSEAPQRMQCMEVWGGNRPVDTSVALVGLDAWVYSEPIDHEQGGDVYYVSTCATGRVTRMILADVSGHGASAAKPAQYLRGLMRRFSNFFDQKQVISALNRQFSSQSEEGRFATAVLVTYYSPTGNLTISNAGHPPPLLYRAATGQWSVMDMHTREARERQREEPSNIPLGIIDRTWYEQFAIELRAGDLVLCHTDSITEAFNPDNRMLRTDGVVELLNTLPTNEPSLLIPILLERIRALHERNFREDDVTLLLIKPTADRTGVSWGTIFKAPLVFLRACLDSLQPDGPPMPWPQWFRRR